MPRKAPMPAAVRRVVDRIGENCEPALCTVLFVGGAGGSLRAGVTENPILLTRSIKSLLTSVTCGGAPAYIWPGGGITVMVDVAAHAGEQVRLGADAGHRRADRVHDARATTTARSAATSTASARLDEVAGRERRRVIDAEPRQALAAAGAAPRR